ncbi:SURF1 family cytochrome oxidase biogenesis protein [Cellulomonas triticagri]|uniref:SURF1-like protein n=1 Tax=Cellulomonas triticagri TaxID=2483352 RepID=A0A3M2JP74_9CELL|nr:SURF1 family protein [Cellulomonas triticagri]RMI13660.1 SURF1 family protein [Cellulomonas triticagri]
MTDDAPRPRVTLRGNPALRRAVGLVVLAVVVSTACVFLGRWQWHRHVARDAAIRLVEQNYSADPVPLADLLPGAGADLDPGDVWRQATITGTYDADATVLLRNRPVNSEPGFHVLTPLVLADGSALVVDRGWVAWDDDASGEVSLPAPPSGEVDVTVHLRPDEPASERSAPAGQVQAIHVDQVLAAGGTDVASFGGYGAVVEERPAADVRLGSLPAPSTDPGSHLSYAFQWWTFAVGSLGAFGWLARRELLEADQPDGEPGAVPTAQRSRRRRTSDEDTEDALIDAQLP